MSPDDPQKRAASSAPAPLASLLRGLHHRGLAVGPDDAARVAVVFQHAASWSRARKVSTLQALLARSDEERRVIEQLAPFLFLEDEAPPRLRAGYQVRPEGGLKPDIPPISDAAFSSSAGPDASSPGESPHAAGPGPTAGLDEIEALETPSDTATPVRHSLTGHRIDLALRLVWLLLLLIGGSIVTVRGWQQFRRPAPVSPTGDPGSANLQANRSAPPASATHDQEPASIQRGPGLGGVRSGQGETVNPLDEVCRVVNPPAPPVWPFWTLLGICLAPAAGLELFVRRYRRQQRNLEAVARSTGPRTWRLEYPADLIASPIDPKVLREAAFHLSAPSVDAPAPWLDSSLTVQATVANAGRLELRYSRQRAHRPILLIEDVSASMARWSDYGRMLEEALARQGSRVVHRFMDGTPGVLSSRRDMQEKAPLDQVLADLGDPAVVVVSDARALDRRGRIDPAWLGPLGGATWLHPRPVELWDGGARWLADRLRVTPLSEEGLLHLGTPRREGAFGLARRWRSPQASSVDPTSVVSVWRTVLGEEAFWWLAAGALLHRIDALTTRLWWGLIAEGLFVAPWERLERVWELPGLQVGVDGSVILPDRLTGPLVAALEAEQPALLSRIVAWAERWIAADVATLEAGSLGEVTARAARVRLQFRDPDRRDEARRGLKALVTEGFGDWLGQLEDERRQWGLRWVSPLRTPGRGIRVLGVVARMTVVACAALLFKSDLRALLFAPPEPDIVVFSSLDWVPHPSGDRTHIPVPIGATLYACDRRGLVGVGDISYLGSFSDVGLGSVFRPHGTTADGNNVWSFQMWKQADFQMWKQADYLNGQTAEGSRVPAERVRKTARFSPQWRPFSLRVIWPRLFSPGIFASGHDEFRTLGPWSLAISESPAQPSANTASTAPLAQVSPAAPLETPVFPFKSAAPDHATAIASKPPPGYLTLVSAVQSGGPLPDGIEIEVDGQKAGTTPANPVALEPGVHVVMARARGCRPMSSAVTIRSKATSAMGYFCWSSDPSAASTEHAFRLLTGSEPAPLAAPRSSSVGVRIEEERAAHWINDFTLSLDSAGQCPEGLTRCGDTCVSLKDNPLHAGACFHIMPALSEEVAEQVDLPPPPVWSVSPRQYYRMYYRWTADQQRIEVNYLPSRSGWDIGPSPIVPAAREFSMAALASRGRFPTNVAYYCVRGEMRCAVSGSGGRANVLEIPRAAMTPVSGEGPFITPPTLETAPWTATAPRGLDLACSAFSLAEELASAWEHHCK